MARLGMRITAISRKARELARPHPGPMVTATGAGAERTRTTAGLRHAEPAGTAIAGAFGSLVDLAKIQAGSASAEICDACNTINMGSARCCKCCSRKLPAFYAATADGAKAVGLRIAAWSGRSPLVADHASALDFAAFFVVINLLVAVTASIPIP